MQADGNNLVPDRCFSQTATVRVAQHLNTMTIMTITELVAALQDLAIIEVELKKGVEMHHDPFCLYLLGIVLCDRWAVSFFWHAMYSAKYFK